MTPSILVRPLTTIDEFHRCVHITQQVWGDSDLETEPHITFVIAAHTGGQVLGAFDGDLLVGLVKSYVGLHDRTPYLHSHMAAVLPSHRNQHVGRALKLFQREDALRRGFRLIEWTFDPLETRNAHFNINRLGAISRQYIPNFYGITTSPLHRGIPTDRLLVEWHLDSKRVIAAINDLTPELSDFPALVRVPLDPGGGLPFAVSAKGGSSTPSGAPGSLSEPGSWGSPSGAPHSVFEGGSRVSPSALSSILETQSRIRSEFTTWFSKGYAVLGVRTTHSGTDYGLAPYSDF